MRRLPLLLAMGGLALTLSSCYFNEARKAQEAGGPVPWWCTATEEIPVTSGPAVGTVDWYAGTHKGPLNWDDCINMSLAFDGGKQFAERYPTRGSAESAGFREMTNYIPGMGTHHARGGITAQMLASASFDRHNPILDNAGLDGTFDPKNPEVLQFGGNTADAKLVGYDYYVRTTTGRPPAGFAGNNDWWHHHPWICYRRTDAAMVAFNVSDATCSGQNGVNVNMSRFYMLHVWVLDNMKFIPDVFAGQMPCISGGTANFDPNAPCHFSRTTAAMAAAGPAGGGTRAGLRVGPTGHRFICSLA
jgi:hypothetical protein